MKKTYLKSAFRMFSKQIMRFLTIVAIIIVSVGFMSGIGETNTKIKTALTNYYASQNVSDFLIKSSSQTGFTTDQINYITEKFGEENVMKGFSMEQKIDEQTYRIFSLDLKDMKISKFEQIGRAHV